MTCKEIHEQITAYVDDRVDEQEYRQKVQQHITYCPDCRAAYELELRTKMVVRQSAERAAASDALRQAISSGVDAMSEDRRQEIAHAAAAGQRGGLLDRFGEYFLSPAGVAVALLLVILGSYVLFVPAVSETGPVLVEGNGEVVPVPVAEVPENFFNKAAQNFSAILEGKLTVQHPTKDRGDLNEYFRSNGIAYPVAFPQVRADLAGGVISQHGATKFAHLVYTVGDTIIYFFEVPHNALQKGDVVYVAPNVLADLEGGKQFWEEPNGTMRLVMYRSGDVIMAAVSNAPKRSLEQLLAVR